MGHKGMEITSQEDYIFSDTIPYNPEIDLEELKVIQTKIENYTSGRSTDGITSQEAEIFLDWVTFNSRNYAVRYGPESPVTAPMTGMCAPTQNLNVKLLRRMGLDARAFNTADCIGNVPMTMEDITRVQNGWFSPNVRHSVSLVNIPIIDNNGNTQTYKFLLDPTFRQFCLRENCNSVKFFDENWLSRGHAAPHPGYFMERKNLVELGVSEEIAQKTEMLGRCIISKGYFYLSEENAKLYADAFVRASERIDFQGNPIFTTGKEYIENFENIPMQMLGNRDDEEYMKLPSEVKQKKQGLFSKLKGIFEKIFKKDETKMLLSGTDSQIYSYGKSKLDEYVLRGEELNKYREATKDIPEKFSNSNIRTTTTERNYDGK